MTNDRENNLQPGRAESSGSDRKEPFNELSELSLEERMAAADRIGIPVEGVGEAAATGTASGPDDVAGGSNDRMDNESTGEGPDR